MEETTQERPLVTFALFAYNQEEYIREAIEGAFSQTYEPLEIILSDDCSTDNTFSIMQEMAADYLGQHNVIVNRNKNNLGIGGHVKKIGGMASGSIIVMAAGDDVSLGKRVENLVRNYDESTYAVFSDAYTVKDNIRVSHGDWIKCFPISISDIVKSGGGVGSGATYSYRKECFSFPWEYPSHIKNEDRILPLRAILMGKIKHLSEELVFYRIHGKNVSGSSGFVVARNNPNHMEEVVKTIDFFCQLPETTASNSKKLKDARVIATVKAKRYQDKVGLYTGNGILKRGLLEFYTFSYDKKLFYKFWRRKFCNLRVSMVKSFYK